MEKEVDVKECSTDMVCPNCMQLMVKLVSAERDAEKLRVMVEALCDRVAKQSELLCRRSEK
jgi:hypothetical protein